MENKEKETCPWCRGSKIVVREGRTQYCQCIIRSRFKAKLKHIGNLKIDKDLVYSMGNIDPYKDLVLYFHCKDQEKVNGTIAYLWAKLGLFPQLKVMNSYELIEIYLGKSKLYNSVLDIEAGILVLTYGYCEFENKRLPDIILQTLESRRSKGLVTWFLVLGESINLPPLTQYFSDQKYMPINVGKKVEKSQFQL